MNADRERVARVALSQLGEPGAIRLASAVAEMGALDVYASLRHQRTTRGLLDDVALRLAALDPERDLELAERQGIRFVVPSDDEWPDQVDDLDAAEPVDRVGRSPLGLWVRGPARLDQLRHSVAVVGSRTATTYGNEVASSIAATVSSAGRAIISGGAFGIDIAAHRGALAVGGTTIAVLACGVDRAYPKDHQQLLAEIAATGAVVSELAPGRSPMRSRFLSRNRVIAALGTGTVVVEAAIRSGALNTANWSARLNRVLMGVPGPVTSPLSQGVHTMLRGASAALVTGGDDVLELVGESGTHLVEVPRGPVRTRDRLSQRQRQVLDATPLVAPARTDAVARTAGMALLEVGSTLALLARHGLVQHDEEGWRQARAAGR